MRLPSCRCKHRRAAKISRCLAYRGIPDRRDRDSTMSRQAACRSPRCGAAGIAATAATEISCPAWRVCFSDPLRETREPPVSRPASELLDYLSSKTQFHQRDALARPGSTSAPAHNNSKPPLPLQANAEEVQPESLGQSHRTETEDRGQIVDTASGRNGRRLSRRSHELRERGSVCWSSPLQGSPPARN